jgi:hypothetical protein
MYKLSKVQVERKPTGNEKEKPSDKVGKGPDRHAGDHGLAWALYVRSALYAVCFVWRI